MSVPTEHVRTKVSEAITSGIQTDENVHPDFDEEQQMDDLNEELLGQATKVSGTFIQARNNAFQAYSPSNHIKQAREYMSHSQIQASRRASVRAAGGPNSLFELYLERKQT